jgi:hypothetical protein
MKSRLMLAMATAMLLGLGPVTARAGGGLAGSGDPFTLSFDELGNGLIDMRDGTGPHPISPVGGATNLIFALPTPVITGDVRFWEDFVGGTLSDVLRFTNANGDLDGGLNGTVMIVYSDLPEPGTVGGLADVGIPTNLTPRDGGGFLEIGPEGNNGATYSPGGPFDNTYVFRSDGSLVPEPASIIMLSLGTLGAAGYGWRRRRWGVA